MTKSLSQHINESFSVNEALLFDDEYKAAVKRSSMGERTFTAKNHWHLI